MLMKHKRLYIFKNFKIIYEFHKLKYSFHIKDKVPIFSFLLSMILRKNTLKRVTGIKIYLDGSITPCIKVLRKAAFPFL